jgi:chromosome segregation ATPase
MAALGFLLMGLLFGIALTAVMGVFLILLASPEHRAELRAGRLPYRQLLGLEARVVPERRAEPDPRLQALQQELKVTQRLVDQARAAREAHQAEVQRLNDELVELRSQLAARDEVYRETQATLDRELERARDLEQDVSTRADELSRANSELKDLRIELDVLQSGEGMTATQVQRLQKERDALVVLANRLKQALLQAQRAAGAQPVVAEPTR